MDPKPQLKGSAATRPGRVLVVEDQPFDRDLLVRVIQSDGHEVVTATLGTQGLQLLEQQNPDVVLCDVSMPEMSGLDFCRAVKSRTDRPFVPVLLVTGRTTREDILAGFAAGADDYIVKPIEFQELKARVRNMVRIRQLQTELESKSRKLEEAKREMEQFLHAVSHDLRAPVISLTGLASMLMRSHAGNLSAEGLQMMERLQSSAHSMAALVNYLVEFARMGTAPHRPRLMNLRALIDQACINLSAQIAAAHAQIKIDDHWPSLQIDPVSICQVFQNLIGNALKFMGGQSQPIVQVGCEQAGNEWRCSVRDNGVGIPPEKHQDIFRLFSRLGQIETEGLGVGLSTAQQITQRHGGRIWVESQLGQGATFFFTLPTNGMES